MEFINKLLVATGEAPRYVVFPEGNDFRIQQAARRLYDEQRARPILIGNLEEVESTAKKAGIKLHELTVLDPATFPADKLDFFAQNYLRGRPDNSIEVARRLMRKPLFFGAMLVNFGEADAVVAGVSYPTARVIEAGLMTVGLAQGINTPSSFFLMLVPGSENSPRQLIFSDCAVNIDPTSEQLADIAIASAASASQVLQETPRVALLSFSTKGSARHAMVDKVTRALAIARQRAPGLDIDGELQADSALSRVVASNKIREPGTVAGNANVLVFPDLNSGNIGYKLTQYLAGATAIGPMLQGFAKPVCDLSRGASVDDIIASTAIALAQSTS